MNINMKRLMLLLISALVLLSGTAQAQSKDIVKTGINIGPLPAIAFDADKGFQYGAILQLFNYGDGSSYPNYKSKWYFEASFFTKGSSLYTIRYDKRELFPGVRMSSELRGIFDKAMDFYGFNGYESYYDYNKVAAGKIGDSYLFSPFYKLDRKVVTFKTDFIGKIDSHLKWELGYQATWFGINSINRASINKGKSEKAMFPDEEPTLYENYVKWGLISEDEANGGLVSAIRAGIQYDSRDKEGAPTRGIWADAHIIAAPKFLGTKNPFTKYAITWRQYFPLIDNDILTLAYRLNYQGIIGRNAPFYALPYMTIMGENSDRDAFGGYGTIRGVLRDRVCGLDSFCYTAELRWRFVKFHLFKQNISFGLSAFSDGAMITRGRSMAYGKEITGPSIWDQLELGEYKMQGQKESLHASIGSGLRFIMNENFIVAFEYGMPVSHLVKSSKYYNQDGNGAFYINLGYIF